MPERWRRELRRLDDVHPSDDVWDRARLGSTRDLPGLRPGSRLTALLVSLLVVSLVGVGLWRATLSTSTLRPEATRNSGYYIELPPLPELPHQGSPFVSFTAKTNLPDGTRIHISTESIGQSDSGEQCCPAISNGRIPLELGSDPCYESVGSESASGAILEISVRPVFDDVSFHHPAPLPGQSPQPYSPPSQPASVAGVLGQHFERLTGDQVVVDHGVRQLVVMRKYTWPVFTCDLRHSALNPQQCPASPTGERLQASTPDQVLVAVTGALSQARLCELWQDDMVAAFRVANPWPGWRDRMQRWIEGLGGFGSGDTHQAHGLKWMFIERSSERIVADVYLRGLRIAQIEAVHLPDPPNADPNVVPLWGLVRFDLS